MNDMQIISFETGTILKTSILFPSFYQGIQLLPVAQIPKYDTGQSFSKTNIESVDELPTEDSGIFIVNQAVLINFENKPSWLVCLEDTAVIYPETQYSEHLLQGRYRIIRQDNYRPIYAINTALDYTEL